MKTGQGADIAVWFEELIRAGQRDVATICRKGIVKALRRKHSLLKPTCLTLKY